MKIKKPKKRKNTCGLSHSWFMTSMSAHSSCATVNWNCRKCSAHYMLRGYTPGPMQGEGYTEKTLKECAS